MCIDMYTHVRTNAHAHTWHKVGMHCVVVTALHHKIQGVKNIDQSFSPVTLFLHFSAIPNPYRKFIKGYMPRVLCAMFIRY